MNINIIKHIDDLKKRAKKLGEEMFENLNEPMPELDDDLDIFDDLGPRISTWEPQDEGKWECKYGPEHEYGDNGRCVWCNESKKGD